MTYIEREETDQTGDCTCQGKLDINKQGMCKISNKTKMVGTSGTGTGVVQLQLFAEDGTVLFKEDTILTVGSHFLRGIARKEKLEEFEINKDILNKTKYIAFRAKAFETSGWDNSWVPWALVAGVIVTGVTFGTAGVVIAGGWIIFEATFDF